MKIAVVTGTSTGIGFATSLHLARHGYRVFAGMRNLAKAEPLRAAAAGSLPVEVIALDVTSGASMDAAFQPVAAAGPIDVLVNNAGISGASPLELTPEDEHRRMFETNYFGAIRCIQAVLPAMRERRTRRHRERHLRVRPRSRCPTRSPTRHRNGRSSARARRSPTRCGASACASSTWSPAW